MRPVLSRLAAIALLVGGVLIGGRLLGVFGTGPVPVEIHYMLGAETTVAAIESRFHRPGRDETLAIFETRMTGPDVKHETRLPAGEIDVEIILTGGDGTQTSVKRSIRAERGAVIRLNLAPEVPKS